MEQTGSVVLIVDDDDGVRFVVTQGLRGLGYAAEQAEGGDEALKLVSADPGRFTCCLLDLTMPGYEGSSLARELAGQAPSLVFVLMSGTDEVAAREHFADLPVVGYLGKPFSVEQLGAAVIAVAGPPGAD